MSTLCEQLSGSLRAWEGFMAPAGDQRYFTDMPYVKAGSLLNSINESFQRLADLERKLLRLADSCGMFENIVGLCHTHPIPNHV
jgi:hypothetical protein